MNLTPLRIATLQLLADSPHAWLVSALPPKLCPRVGSTGNVYRWRRQAAARMGGMMVAALKRAGYVKVTHADSGVGWVTITAEGRAVLERLKPTDLEALDQAINNATIEL